MNARATRRVVVTGAGGFVGHHLTTFLKRRGLWVRGVDSRRPAFGPTSADEFRLLDLRRSEDAVAAMEGVEEAYALAADMGGMGYISFDQAKILHDNALIDLHSIEAARRQGVSRYLYASSACVYPEHRQDRPDIAPLREEEAYPAAPQDSYGWEKLLGERLCEYYALEHGLETRIARFHNVYGPLGTFEGGREKAPAAICRKVALAAENGELVLWGDGRQTRSFCYVDDCVEGIYRLMRSDYSQPLNIGSDRMLTIDELAEIVMSIADRHDLTIKHVEGPEGVRGRNSDNTRLRAVLGWEPQVSLEEGLTVTYRWIAEQLRARQPEEALRYA